MKTQITLSQALEGYSLDVHARQLSSHTIADYYNGFRHFQDFIGDPLLNDVTTDDIRRFLTYLGEHPITPAGVAPRPPRVLKGKSIRNIYIALSTLWTWALSEGLVEHHVVSVIKPPRPEQTAIEPLSRQDVESLLAVCARTQSYTRPGKRECTNTRPTADRDRAIILLLLDTGIRAAELCPDPRHGAPGLLIEDVDQRNRHIKVTGKGKKERVIPIDPRTLKAVWRYLLTRPDAAPTEPLITITTSGLRHLLRRLSQRAGIQHVHPHRFRHTFAINFLRNGGNALELQRLLGHTTLEMVKRYVALAQVDLDAAHRKASPVANWKL